MDLLQQLSETKAFLEGSGIYDADLAILLNPAVKKHIDGLQAESIISYSEVPHFPGLATGPYSGHLIYGRLQEKKVLVFRGTFHFHVGYTMKEVTYPVRVAAALGCGKILLMDLGKGIGTKNNQYPFMLVNDHINLLPENPLRGRNHDTLGPRFPDMGKAYNPSFNSLIRKVAIDQNFGLYDGVYAAAMGPNNQTATESQFLHKIGVDAVGFGIVPEVIVANHMQLPCAALVMISNCPHEKHMESHGTISSGTTEAENNLGQLMKQVIKQL